MIVTKVLSIDFVFGGGGEGGGGTEDRIFMIYDDFVRHGQP